MIMCAAWILVQADSYLNNLEQIKLNKIKMIKNFDIIYLYKRSLPASKFVFFFNGIVFAGESTRVDCMTLILIYLFIYLLFYE